MDKWNDMFSSEAEKKNFVAKNLHINTAQNRPDKNSKKAGQTIRLQAAGISPISHMVKSTTKKADKINAIHGAKRMVQTTAVNVITQKGMKFAAKKLSAGPAFKKAVRAVKTAKTVTNAAKMVSGGNLVKKAASSGTAIQKKFNITKKDIKGTKSIISASVRTKQRLESGMAPLKNAPAGAVFSKESFAGLQKVQPAAMSAARVKTDKKTDSGSSKVQQELHAISYTDLTVEGYSFLRVINLKMEEALNEHTRLELTGILKEDKQDDAVHHSEENKSISVSYQKDGKKKVLFTGIVTYVENEVKEGVYYFTIKAQDSSQKMDLTPKCRSFQNASMTAGALIKTVMKDYEGADCILFSPDEPIGTLVVQFEETDWEFLKRFASHYNVPLIPDSSLNGIRLFIGAQDSKVELESKPYGYTAVKDCERYHYLKESFQPDLKESDFIYYTMERFEVLKLGEHTEIDGLDFYVSHAMHEMKQGILMNTYWLCPKKGLSVETLYHDKLSGCSVDGTIAAVQGSKVQVDLLMDGGKEKPVHWFDFSTMSASSDGSGWYCMPEPGDSVKVYFPDKKEEAAFAISAVSNYVQGASETEDRMGNPDNKYLRTAADKQVRLTGEGIFITCNSGQAEASLKSDGVLTIQSKQNINVVSQTTIDITAKEKFLISGKKEVVIQCDKGGALILDEEGMVREMGVVVNNN